MRNHSKIFYLFSTYFLIELAIIVGLIFCHGWDGVFSILLLMTLTFYLGIRLIRKVQLQSFLKELQTVGTRGNVADEITNRLLFFLAGIFLILPGILGDFVGFLLLIPTFRTLFAKRCVPLITKYPGNFVFWGNRVSSGFSANVNSQTMTSTIQENEDGSNESLNTEDEIIDVEIVEKK